LGLGGAAAAHWRTLTNAAYLACLLPRRKLTPRPRRSGPRRSVSKFAWSTGIRAICPAGSPPSYPLPGRRETRGVGTGCSLRRPLRARMRAGSASLRVCKMGRSRPSLDSRGPLPAEARSRAQAAADGTRLPTTGGPLPPASHLAGGLGASQRSLGGPRPRGSPGRRRGASVIVRRACAAGGRCCQRGAAALPPFTAESMPPPRPMAGVGRRSGFAGVLCCRS
jgi:hypothetical protein